MSQRRILLGVSGGIAAYKSVELLRIFQREGHDVAVVLTEEATRFVAPLTYAALTRHPVRTSIWNSPEPNPHIVLGSWAEIFVIAPCTANTLGKLAHGLGSDLLSLTALATEAALLVAPAMHHEMWHHAAVQENLAKLQERGATVVEPEFGVLAGGDSGEGRLASLEAIRERVDEALAVRASRDHPKVPQQPAISQRESSSKSNVPLAGKRIVVTAGGTREPLDAVRVLTNRSSGKQGHAIALEAQSRGADVTLITTMPDQLSERDLPLRCIPVATAEEMANAVLAHAPQADAIIMAAAVADFRPKHSDSTKRKKTEPWGALELEATTDILAILGDEKRRKLGDGADNGKAMLPILVGFAAETNNVEMHAKGKLREKNLDLIVANNVTGSGETALAQAREGEEPPIQGGFGSDFNRVEIYDHHGLVIDSGLVSKGHVARILCDELVNRFPQ